MIWLFFLLAAFVGGQILSVSFSNGIRISALDIMVVLINLRFWFTKLFKHQKKDNYLVNYFQIFGPFLIITLLSLAIRFFDLSAIKVFISSLYLWRFYAYSNLIFITAKFPGKNKIGKWLWFGGLGIGILGLLQYFLYPNLRNLYYLGWDPHQYRIFSTLLDANFSGIILVLTLFLGLYLLQEKLVSRKTGLILLVFNFAALLLTYSRGSYLAFFSGLAVYLFVKKKLGLLVIISGVFLGLVLLLPRPGGEGVNLLRVMSIESRLQNSQEAWQIWSKNPLLGVGFNTLRYVRGQTEVVTGTDSLSHSGAGFHNSWLFILATTGILGLLSYIYAVIKIFKLTTSVTRQTQKQLILVTFIAVAVHSLFDNSLFYPYVIFWVWTLCGSFSQFKEYK